ncbi:type II toxin-antitoxin system RelE/ParE family toxin [Candidatus Palauibacter sp.]|uniref:type II toxin-antitoxin system RelE/ParE family toxin n=1 Tax=Candidatus Palauibacter sp. TaxID=3101350 RepID=UPI003AF2F1C9
MERVSGACPVGDFLDGLPPGARVKLDAMFQRLGEEGSLWNKTRFKKIDADIFAIRSDQVRIFCFFTEDARLVLLHALKKKRNRHKPRDIKRAKQMRREFLNNQNGDN